MAHLRLTHWIYLLTLCAATPLGFASLTFAQDADPVTETPAGTAADTTPASSMEDVLNALEKNPPAADAPVDTPPIAAQPDVVPNRTSVDTAPVPTTDNLQRITPPDHPIKASTTMPGENVPAQPLENMNPALLPQAPTDEAPKAVRAETPPVPPKPPAYDARPYVTLQTLDKVTARTATMTVKVGDTVAIGPLFVQVKTCQQAAPLETPDSAAFLQVWEAKPKDAPAVTANKDNSPSQWVFSGWMFGSSPALSAMDHPIYDIWVLNCKKSAKDEAEKSDAAKPGDTKPDDKASSAVTVPAADKGDDTTVDDEAAQADTSADETPPAKAAASKSE